MAEAARTDLNVALEYLAALGGDDPSHVAELVSTDFRNEHVAEIASGCVGRDEYETRLPGFFATFPNRRYEVVETSVGSLVDDSRDGSEVIVRYRFGADVEGIRLDIPGVMWISVRDGLVIRRLDCWDSLTYHRQTGTVPVS
ncbi:MAG: nuclear transport factor 2 family protein [Ilumatobacter sp.]